MASQEDLKEQTRRLTAFLYRLGPALAGLDRHSLALEFFTNLSGNTAGEIAEAGVDRRLKKSWSYRDGKVWSRRLRNGAVLLYEPD